MEKKVFAFDLDGTLTEHRTWVTDENLAVLEELKERGVRIIITGAGQAKRIYAQMRECPIIDIIGNYGMQYFVYREASGGMEAVRDIVLPCDRESVSERVTALREQFGYAEYVGESVEFHPSGCVTIPLLGTKAEIHDKLMFDPDRSVRRAIYSEVAAMFPEYSVFVGGSSSFDMAPMPYNKYYALDLFCREEGYSHSDLVYFGDDYGTGGNDEVVYQSDIDFITVKRFTNIPELVHNYIK
ncbi:MAG: HAD-IIB family hydrolase [Eubacteriales bacterium]